ncbi:MAG TPA: portal protein, partial [Candidatus Cybelea sp.]|nr:portal protein [Candidatus Cybelea sp.]
MLLDPSHQEQDGSDAEWEFMGRDYLWDDYVAEFPTIAGEDNPLLAHGNSDTAWRALGDDYPDWFIQAGTRKRQDGTTEDIPKSVRVMTYWYASYETRELCILSDGALVWRDEIPKKDVKKGKKVETVDDLGGRTIADTRLVSQRTVRCSKIDGAQVLEDVECAGPDMPIVKVIGEELQPYDHERRTEGMVRPARSAGQGTNYMVSKLVETVGWSPLTPLIADPDAIEGFPEWEVLSSRVVPYARARSYDDQGRPLQEPHRPNADPNLAPMTQAIAMFAGFTEKTTAVPAARLGDIDPVTRSGQALKVLTQNSQQSTSNYLDNLVRSMKYEAKIINNLLYPIYGARPGRLVRIMTGEGN